MKSHRLMSVPSRAQPATSSIGKDCAPEQKRAADAALAVYRNRVDPATPLAVRCTAESAR
jgi:hypothetical protein